MRRMMLLIGAAALAATIPAIAQDQGRGGGRGQGRAADAQKGGGQGQGRAERGRGAERQAARAEPKGRGKSDDRGGAQRAGRQDERERRVERAIGQERRAAAEARRGRPDRVDDRQLARRDDRRDWRGWAGRSLVRRDRLVGDRIDFRALRSRGLAVGPGGCPPGLARQNAFCMPPGQLRKARFIGQRLPLFGLPYNVPARYRYRFGDNDRFIYRYGDGIVYRFDRGSGLVSSVIPLASTGLFPGEPLPLGYDVYNVPLAYRSYYPDTRDYLYRYDSGSIYRVNPGNGLIDGIVAMTTGGVGGLGGLGVGDPLPLGYDAYNMPLAYRDRYYDRNDAWYRYADGNVYQVDPQTRLIESVISTLV